MKSGTRRIITGFVMSTLLATVLACGSTPPPPPATATANLPPTQTSLPTPTSGPLFQLVTLTSVSRNETGQAPGPIYTLKAQIPALQGSSDARVTNVNDEMVLLTQEEVAKFKDNASEVQVPAGSSGSTYDQQYKLLSPPGNLISLKFQIKNQIYQTSHPKNYSRTVNYDLEAGADVTMESLFLPGSDYLARISNYCIAQLKTRPIDFESYTKGALPSPENYGSWNITPSGLQITFAENQVAATEQEVVVPYSELQADIDPHGALAGFIP
jgi:hypothetical protein